MTESVGNNRTASTVQALLERLHARHAGDLSEEVANYILELAGADPEWVELYMVTAHVLV